MRDALVSFLGSRAAKSDVRCAPLPSFRNPQLRATLAFVRALVWSDAIILAGGSHFHDRYGRRSYRILATHLCVFRAAALLGKRVGYGGIGVGPLSTRAGQRIAKRLLSVASSVLTRDERSAEVTRRLGVITPPVVGFDSAVLLGDSERGIRPTARTLGVSLIPYFSVFQGQSDADRDLVESLASGIALTAESSPLAVAIFPFNRAGFISDLDVSAQLAQSLALGGTPSRLEAELSATAMIARLSRLAGLIATRYHALVLGYLANVPMIAVVYDEKCEAFARQIGLPGRAIVRPEELLMRARANEIVKDLVTSPELFQPSLPVWQAKKHASRGLSAFADRLMEDL